MAATEITVLKNNVPWGPFSREQIEDGLARGDFTVKYLAHAPGLKEWLPLGEVLHYLEVNEGPRPPSLPPVPGTRELPPVPNDAKVELVPSVASTPPPAQPPILPAAFERKPAPPVLPPVMEQKEIVRENRSEANLPAGSVFARGIAFLIDCVILFLPVGGIFILGALVIEVPALFHHVSDQSKVEQWDLLKLNMGRLAWLVAIGFGWLYGAGFECSRAQATIGKRWVGIKVTDIYGERLSFLRATGRYLAKYLSALPCFLGFIMALFSSRNLTLHDRLSGTCVVKK